MPAPPKCRDVLTTADCARLLSISAGTVRRCIDRGTLPAWTHPGKGGHRRVMRCDLEEFARSRGIPLRNGI